MIDSSVVRVIQHAEAAGPDTFTYYFGNLARRCPFVGVIRNYHSSAAAWSGTQKTKISKRASAAHHAYAPHTHEACAPQTHSTLHPKRACNAANICMRLCLRTPPNCSARAPLRAAHPACAPHVHRLRPQRIERMLRIPARCGQRKRGAPTEAKLMPRLT
jgi:hypothetical protein